jgi:hypothetical protein
MTLGPMHGNVRKAQKTAAELLFVVPTSQRLQRYRLFQSPRPSSSNQNVAFPNQLEAALTQKGVKGRLRPVVELKLLNNLLLREKSDDSPVGGVDE